MRLLTKAISGLPEHEESTVLAFLLGRALLAPAAGPAAHDKPRAHAAFSASLGGEPWRVEQTARWPRTGALLLLYQAAAGVSVAQTAAELGIELEMLQAILEDLSKRLRSSDPLGALFGEFAQGRSLSEAAERLGRAHERFGLSHRIVANTELRPQREKGDAEAITSLDTIEKRLHGVSAVTVAPKVVHER